MHLFTFSLTVGSLVACAGGVAAPVAPPRAASTRAPARVAKNDPLIVDWPNAARGKFEARTRKGVVAIRYVDNTMNLVDDCTTGQPYAYTGFTRKEESVTIRTAEDLKANLPIYGASFQGTLARTGELGVEMTLIGRFDAPPGTMGAHQLKGDCSATATTASFDGRHQRPGPSRCWRSSPASSRPGR